MKLKPFFSIAGLILSCALAVSRPALSSDFDDTIDEEAFNGDLIAVQPDPQSLPPEYESYTESSDPEQRKPLQLELKEEGFETQPQTPRLPRRGSDFALILKRDLPREVTLKEARYENGEPILEVEAQGKNYRIRFGQWVFSEVAGAKIHRALGFPTRSIEIASNLKIRLGSINSTEFLKYWARSPDVLQYQKHLESPREDRKGEYVIARQVMIELLPAFSAREETWSVDLLESEKTQPESRSILAIEAWLQNNDLAEHRNNLLRVFTKPNGQRITTQLLEGFRYSFGNSLTLSSPNLLGADVVANASEVRSRLSRGQSVTARLRFAPYGRYREALSRTSLADLREGIVRIASLSEADLIRIFTEACYPGPVARLIAAKLIRRANQMIETFQPRGTDGRLLPPLAGENPARISDPPRILRGSIEQDYPDFDTDLTATFRERLLTSLMDSLKGTFDTLTRELLSNFPSKIGQVSWSPSQKDSHGNPILDSDGVPVKAKWALGPGWDFRVKRKVSANPHPTGTHDLFIVRDEMMFSISIGIGLNEILGSPVWANIAPGFERTWVYQSLAPSEEAGWKHAWMIPYRMLHDADFAKLKPGESFGVQSGISLAAMAGMGRSFLPKDFLGWSKAHTKNFRLGGYVSGGYEHFWRMQVTRPDAGSYVITRDRDNQVFSSAKAYLQYIARWMRTSLARITIGHGWNHGKIFEIQDEKSVDPAARMALAYALQTGEFDGLEKYFPPTDRQSTYDLFQAKLSLFVIHGALTEAESNQVLSRPASQGGGKRYVHVSRETRQFDHSLGSGASSHICRYAGVVEFEDEAHRQVKDRFLQVTCALKDARTLPDELEEDLELVSEAANQRFDFASLLAQAQSTKEIGRSQIKFTLKIYNDALSRLFALKPKEWWRSHGSSHVVRQPGDGSSKIQYFTHETWFASRMLSMLSEKDDAQKMDALVTLIAANRLNNPYLPLLTGVIDGFYNKVEIMTDAMATASHPAAIFESGRKNGGPAQQYLDEIEPMGTSNYFIEY